MKSFEEFGEEESGGEDYDETGVFTHTQDSVSSLPGESFQNLNRICVSAFMSSLLIFDLLVWLETFSIYIGFAQNMIGEDYELL